MWKQSIALVFLLSSMCSAFLVGENSTDLLFYFRDVSVTLRPTVGEKEESQVYDNTNTKVTWTYETSDDRRTIEVQLMIDGPKDLVSKLEVNMTIKAGGTGYWGLSNTTATVVYKSPDQLNLQSKPMISSITMEAPLGQSFTCGRFGKLYPAFRANTGNFTPVIEFSGVQIQAFNMTDGKFGDNWECVGFFSIGIWSGIFISAILIAIITWGLAMIMSVKTMDRFDDPKGKPITFGAGE